MTVNVFHSTLPYFGSSLTFTDDSRRFELKSQDTKPLKKWIGRNRENPYPSKTEKLELSRLSKMSLTQVSTWFANARRRMKKAESGQEENFSDRSSSVDENNDPADNDTRLSLEETPPVKRKTTTPTTIILPVETKTTPTKLIHPASKDQQPFDSTVFQNILNTNHWPPAAIPYAPSHPNWMLFDGPVFSPGMFPVMYPSQHYPFLQTTNTTPKDLSSQRKKQKSTMSPKPSKKIWSIDDILK